MAREAKRAPNCAQWKWQGAVPDDWECLQTPATGSHRSTWKDLYWWATGLAQVPRGEVLQYLTQRNVCPKTQTFKASSPLIKEPMQVGKLVGKLVPT